MLIALVAFIQSSIESLPDSLGDATHKAELGVDKVPALVVASYVAFAVDCLNPLLVLGFNFPLHIRGCANVLDCVHIPCVDRLSAICLRTKSKWTLLHTISAKRALL